MNLEEKFIKGIINNTYQRINFEYKTNIFIGANDEGKLSMVITEYGVPLKVNSTKFIDVKLYKRNDNKLSLSFDLLNDLYKSMFIVFCKDIIISCEKAGPTMAISTAINRWKYWKDLFCGTKYNLLDKQAIKGLLGELIILRDYFIKKYGVSKALRSWLGPELGHKDFEIDDTWYEIKSINTNALQFNVSSFEQLESDIDGHLVLMRIDDSSSTNNVSINLNNVISSVLDIIKNPEDLYVFNEKLNKMGYKPTPEYDNYNFIYLKREIYSVKNDFPRLHRKDFPKAIGNIKYTLLIDAILEYIEI